ncbi:DUF4192 family protein [Microbacterium sp. LRZ72]|uniref:DUF4192 family protein n=1 Tax=Microbacterium sp. LRZ72 TaxID=2942481 RepID=UPI0029ADBB7F|nr:DUF4192 family protein [Microbacterium sp. LRZ72]MDX2376163.1 DUF4192 family protein [Microbacterium sp. LRZ72]
MRTRLLAKLGALPEVTTLMPIAEAERLAREAPSHGESIVAIVPLVEMLLDESRNTGSADMVADLAFLCMMPSIPQAMAVQIAFGRSVGEKHALKIARIVSRAERRGMSVDQYVAELAATDAVPHDTIVRLFLGEARRQPDRDRVRRGIRLLRRNASLLPPPFRTDIFCVIAWLHWSQGQRAIASAYLSDVLRENPDDVLAGGLRALFSRSLPEWTTSVAAPRRRNS